MDLTNFAGTAGLLDDTIILDEAINNRFIIGEANTIIPTHNGITRNETYL
jgi:hypothetical protein